MSYDRSVPGPGLSTRGRGTRVPKKEEGEQEASGDPGPLSGGSVSIQEAGAEGGSSPPRGSSPGGSSDRRGPPTSDDNDGTSSGNDSGERENSSQGRQSTRSSHNSSNGKDSGMRLTESSKSTTSQSLSPPGGSLAYSLLSTSSEQDPPSTSGCSSDQSARLRTQKELMKALKELKIRLPVERKTKGHSSTLDALKYALNCVKQVRANQEYYHQWSVEEGHGCSLDLSSFTAEELDTITSEYTLRNTDTFSMAVSFLSGKVVYVSPQGASLLRCTPEDLQGTVFSELLAPQDVSTFYSHTAPCRLPPWASCTGSESAPPDAAQEKSMFCRVGVPRVGGGPLRYAPFRLSPYQLTLRPSEDSAPQPCCLLLAERVHSGYEAPRIPTDKRVFTTSHTPGCLFQEVDDRAVPLLGYLPQDLVGTPILLYIHPEDRPILVAIHKKILQCAGQPFDHAPLRMCARSGEYLTLDTSWSSFVNPWSRKVAFIVGRHKVRTSPLNEDVFTVLRGCEGRGATPDMAPLSEQIHRLLGRPVHGGGSRGSSVSQASRRSQYLESCNIPNTLKRKSGSSSSASDEDQPHDAKCTSFLRSEPVLKTVYLPVGASVGLLGAPSPLPPLASASKAQSVASVTSQCSFSSTIVHVGDKKPPESDIVMEEAPPPATLAPPTSTLTAASMTPPPPAWAPVEWTGRRAGPGRAGLTREVLSLHTQQEETAFLHRFKDLSKLRVLDPTASSTVHCHPTALGGHRRGRGGKRLRQQEDHLSSVNPGVCLQPPSANASSWPPSAGSQASLPVGPFPPGMLPLYPLYPPQPVAPQAQMVPPMVALVLPNYLFPQMAPGPAVANPGHFYNPSFNPYHHAASMPLPLPLPLPHPLPLPLLGPRAPSLSSPALCVCGSLRQGMLSRSNGAVGSSSQGQTDDQDNMSTSSQLLDLLLQEDSRSGSGSASGSSGSRSGSGSRGHSSSGTSGTRSSHTSKYFGSIDSSENDHARKRPVGGSSSGEEQFIKCVLQDPIWLLMATTDDKVMMTYQLPSRDMEAVLRSDREALRALQKSQPRFSEEQKRELSQVHPWIRTGRLPRAINTSCGAAGEATPPCSSAWRPRPPVPLSVEATPPCSSQRGGHAPGCELQQRPRPTLLV
uniref:PAS domain-containing protein n=1 Tax=Gadus morhua TaxID=8049 RepID=A0A8C5B418_GADMO